MGLGISIICTKCNYSKRFMLGLGMKDHDLESISETLHYKLRNQVNCLMKNHKTYDYKFTRELAYCKRCDRLYEKPIIEITYDEGQVFKNSILCSRCKGDLRIIEHFDQVTKIPCLKCGNKSIEYLECLWD